jgi:hypothetical protein
MKVLSTSDRAAATRRQIKAVEAQLTEEFADLPKGEVHRDVVRVSEALLAHATVTDHIAVLTGRWVAEDMHAARGDDLVSTKFRARA